MYFLFLFFNVNEGKKKLCNNLNKLFRLQRLALLTTPSNDLPVIKREQERLLGVVAADGDRLSQKTATKEGYLPVKEKESHCWSLDGQTQVRIKDHSKTISVAWKGGATGAKLQSLHFHVQTCCCSLLHHTVPSK